jgi:hypothetical protein
MKAARAPAANAPRPTVAARFRAEIEQAAAEGVAADDLSLHMTPGESEQLKRDRNVAVADISFTGGVMRYLGVKVVKSDTPSALRRRTDAPA